MQVRNMNGSSGREVPNQFIINDDHGNTFFQSYRTIIAKEGPLGRVTLDTSALNYSVTTSKYLYRFLDVEGGRKQVLARIADGTYAVADLNA